MKTNMLPEKLIKRDYSSLSIRNDWFWMYIPVGGEVINVISRHVDHPHVSQIFKQDEYKAVKHRNTGVYIISSLPETEDKKPICYYKTEPLYLPLFICGLPDNLDLREADPLPLNTTLSSLEAIRFIDNSRLGKKIIFNL